MFKRHFRGKFLFNGNVKIINASLTFLIKMPTQKAKFYKHLYINQMSQTNFKSFSNQCSDTTLILSSLNSSLPFFSFYMKHIFMLSILFKSYLIRHSGTERESTRALGHSESTRRALREHSEGTRALGHSDT